MSNLVFRTKTVGWRDGFAGEWHLNNILLQNNNGPCFIISLINSLVIASELRAMAQSWTTVSSSKGNKALEEEEAATDLLASDPALLVPLKELLSHREVKLESLLSHLTNLLLEYSDRGLIKDSDDLAGMLNTFPVLHTGLNVDVSFKDCVVTGLDPQVYKMLQVFRLDMIHGWIVDPTTEPHQLELINGLGSFEKCQLYLVEQLSSIKESIPNSQLETLDDSDWADVLAKSTDDPDLSRKVQDFLAVRKFLSDNMTQLTDYGLKQIQTDDAVLANNSVCIFFRNDHFNTMYKRDGELHLLLIDEGYGGGGKYVWERLSSVSGATDVLLDGDFVQHAPKGELPDKIDYSDFVYEDPELNVQAESDQQFAKTLQQKEDEQYAKQLQKSYKDQARKENERRGTQANMAPKAQNEQGVQAKTLTKAQAKAAQAKEKAKKDENCIVM